MMMRSSLSLFRFVALVAVVSSCTTTTTTAEAKTATTTTTAPVETFDINLDLPPQDRWTEVMTKYEKPLRKTLDWLIQLIPKNIMPEIIIASDLAAKTFWAQDIRGEMEGIADFFDIPVGFVLMSNLFYELRNGCTSVVAQHTDANDGSTIMWHGRNLDFDIPDLQAITIHVRFVKSGGGVFDDDGVYNDDDSDGRPVVLYEATTYAGYIGTPTGMKPGAFSISQDTRSDGGSLWENLAEWILKGGRAYSFLYREILENAVDYDDALRRLQETPLISPSYFIIAGVSKGQGAVVSRSRDRAVDTWTIDDYADNDNTKTNRWFLVQTNDDHWLPPEDDRRDATNHHMETVIGDPAHVSADTIFHVMNMHPTLDELTTYTSVISAGTNYFYSVKQNVVGNATFDAAGDDIQLNEV